MLKTRKKKTQSPVVKRIQPLDIDILLGLYYLRAMSTEQIKKRYELTERYTYRKLQILRNTGWIITEPIKGYTRKQRRQGSFHRISETGIACLRKQGYSVERRADGLRVKTRQLPYLLHAYDIFVNIEPFGWKMQDSRMVKARYSLNRNDSLQGIFTSPEGTESAFYVMREAVTPTTLSNMSSEIEKYRKKNQHHEPLINFIIFVGGEKAYHQVVDFFRQEKRVINTTQRLQVMSTAFASIYLRLFYSHQEVMNYLATHNMKDVTQEVYPTLKKKHNGLSTIVEHEGEEKYLVNLMDSDLIKMDKIKNYRKEQYQSDGRKILAVTSASLLNKHREMLSSTHHIEFYPIYFSELSNYVNDTIYSDSIGVRDG